MLPGAQGQTVGVNGVLFSLEPTSGGGAVSVRLDYSAFAGAFGGDWASRLRLVALPGCALATPAAAGCRTQTPLTFRNDTSSHTLQADVQLPGAPSAAADTKPTATPATQSPVVLAATSSGSGGGGGDFTATSLHAAESWQSGGSADSFDWSYPIDTPSVPGGLEPHVALDYDSQSQDGLTSATNNQASAIGDGFGYAPGFVERSYASCTDNPAGTTKTDDECWSPNNTLTLSLGGHSTALVPVDGAATPTWRPQDDENERVQLLTGAPNGAHNGEYWVVTTDDGTRYYFGLDQLPGFASGDTATDSVWTVPVYATASGQPCYNATFADSWCMQAYRWNLDYVVDPHKDAIAYYYATETGHYARDRGTTADTSYTRGGYLAKIAYGQRDGSVYSSPPAAQVTFTYAGRCSTSVTGCDTSTLTSSTASSWPDVPYDLNCASGASCTVDSPTFWSEYELTGIQTQALAGGAETNVDSWSFEHTFPATGDSTSPALWLSSITHTGQDTAGGSSSAQTVPKVSLAGTPLSNRVVVTNGYPPITRQRLNTVTTETGEQISVDYSSTDCASGVPSDASQNTKLCYPEYWTPTGQTAPILDWFNKFRVTAVTEQDSTVSGVNDSIVTHYDPVGTPAWHHDDDPLTASSKRTWNQWRGYQGMRVTVGTAPDPVTETDYTYFRGMNGDTLPGGATRSVSITDSRGDPAVTDSEQFAGSTYETIELAAAGSTSFVSDKVFDPWSSAATATHTLSGLPAQHAYVTGEQREREYSPLAAGGTRETETVFTHDGYGRVTKTDDLGDVGISGDDLCHSTSYADNTSAWILDKIAEQTTVSVDCSTTPSLPADAVSDTRTFYDGSTTLAAAPTTGDITMVQKAASYSGSTPVFATMATSSVDEYGRTLSATDADNRTTTTAYSPATGAEPTSVAVTDPKAFTTTTTYDPLRDLALQTTDPAGYTTRQRYDALGRLTAVFKPGITPAVQTYAYTVSNGAPSQVTTQTLNDDGSYRTSITFYDALLRECETQEATVDGGRTIADTFYNSLGLKAKTTDPYYSSGALGLPLVQGPAGTIPDQTDFVYDGAGRQTAAIESTADPSGQKQIETWRTTTSYNGDDITTTVPPAGATAESEITDARGNTTAVYRYHAGAAADPVHDSATQYDTTAYTYTPDGKRAGMTDAAGNSWSWTYDLLGNPATATDPDTGTTTTAYDNAGQQLTGTDARGKQTTYTYDADGRKTATYDTTGGAAPSSANQTGAWSYDSVKKGMPTSATSYQMGTGSPAYTTQIQAYNSMGLVVARTATLANLPANQAALAPAGGYTTSYTYNLTGSLQTQQDPASGGLPGETVTYGYDKFGRPTTVGGAWSYVSATGYDELGQPKLYTLGPSTSWVSLALNNDPQTHQITDAQTTDSTATQVIDHTTYTYTNNSVSKGAGLLVSTADSQNGAATDTQCYTYDGATRLTGAWTATDNCAATPTPGNSSTVGGVNPYWQTWTYDAAGDRTSETDHDTAGNTANDTTTAYAYPAPGSSSDQPHTLTRTTATGPAAATQTAGYTYDAAGNTTAVTGGATGDQTLTWNDQDRLATDTTSAGTTGYLYDSDGNLVLRTDPTQATLYLDDEEIVEDLGTHTLSGTRYYTAGETTVAERSNTGDVQYLIPDRQGTDTLAIDYQTQAVTRRQYLPFGEQRGPAPATWPGDKGYVGGTPDPATTLENLGAREYDPATGRFLSADPILETQDANQLGGYDYAGNNPVTHSDPDGTMIKDDVTGLGFGNASTMRHWYEDQGYTHHGHATRKFQRVLKSYNHSWNVFYHSSYYRWLLRQPYRRPSYLGPATSSHHGGSSHHHHGWSIGRVWNDVGGKAAVHGVATGAKYVGRGANDGWNWTVEHRAALTKSAALGAFAACIIATDGVCTAYAGGATALSIFSRSYDYAHERKNRVNTFHFVSESVVDLFALKLKMVRAPGWWGAMPLLPSLLTRAGQGRLLLQGGGLAWANFPW